MLLCAQEEIDSSTVVKTQMATGETRFLKIVCYTVYTVYTSVACQTLTRRVWQVRKPYTMKFLIQETVMNFTSGVHCFIHTNGINYNRAHWVALCN